MKDEKSGNEEFEGSEMQPWMGPYPITQCASRPTSAAASEVSSASLSKGSGGVKLQDGELTLDERPGLGKGQTQRGRNEWEFGDVRRPGRALWHKEGEVLREC